MLMSLLLSFYEAIKHTGGGGQILYPAGRGLGERQRLLKVVGTTLAITQMQHLDEVILGLPPLQVSLEFIPCINRLLQAVI